MHLVNHVGENTEKNVEENVCRKYEIIQNECDRVPRNSYKLQRMFVIGRLSVVFATYEEYVALKFFVLCDTWWSKNA